MDTEGGLPILAIMEGSDGVHRAIKPGILNFKTDTKAGTVVLQDGYDIQSTTRGEGWRSRCCSVYKWRPFYRPK